MKVNINNKAKLPFKVIGEIYDKYLNYPYEDTLYENKVEIQLFSYKKKDYKMEIHYKVSCINVVVEELVMVVKREYMRGIKFPGLPKKY